MLLPVWEYLYNIITNSLLMSAILINTISDHTSVFTTWGGGVTVCSLKVLFETKLQVLCSTINNTKK